MNFLDYDLDVSSGDVVVVQLDRAANVRLLDSINFGRYRRRQRHQYFGGFATVSPFRVVVPHDGDWHLVVDLGGYAGRVRASVSVVRG